MDYVNIDNMERYEITSPPLGGYNCIKKPKKNFVIFLYFILIILYVGYIYVESRIMSFFYNINSYPLINIISFIIAIFFVLNLDKIIRDKNKFKKIISNSSWAFFLFPIILFNPIVNIIYSFIINIGVAYIVIKLIREVYLSDLEEKKYNSLMKNGILIKNVKYALVNDTNNPKLKKIKVEYITSDGITLNLISQQSYNYAPDDNDVDILLDKTNFNNYYIDFEIL